MHDIALTSLQYIISLEVHPNRIILTGGTHCTRMTTNNPRGILAFRNDIAHLDIEWESDKLPSTSKIIKVKRYILCSHLTFHDERGAIILSSIIIDLIIISDILI